MLPPSSFLQCLSRALLKTALDSLTGGLPLGSFLVEISREVWEEWSKQRKERQREEELQQLAQATPEELRRRVDETVNTVAAGQPEEARTALRNYLLHVPPTIRRAFRRPEDPSGRTIPPALVLRRPEDLLRLLPDLGGVRFKPGDRAPGMGDWVLVDLLGIGGFSEVWKAHHHTLSNQKPRAIKICPDPEAVRTLHTELTLVERIRAAGGHPGIVPLVETSLSSDPPCLAYEYVEGGDLANLIEAWHRQQGGPKPEQAARVILRLAEIVGFAHGQGITHCDLKPANILVVSGEGGRSFRITDFGIGRLAVNEARREATRDAGRSRLNFEATAVRGAYTPLYASPQQMHQGSGEPNDDVYSLGVIWYQLLTGDLGKGAPTGLRWGDKLRGRGMTESQVKLLASCFDEEASGRPANANVLVERLREAFPELRPTKAPKSSRGAPIGGLILAGFLVGLIGLMILVAVLSSGAQGTETEQARNDTRATRPYQRDTGKTWTDTKPTRAEPKDTGRPAPTTAGPRSTSPAINSTMPNSLGTKFVSLPAGTFWMGGGGGTAGDKQVKVEAFQIGKYEVTQGEWEAIMKDEAVFRDNPPCFSRRGPHASDVKDISDADLAVFPVERVSWDDITKIFLPKLNAREKGSGWVYRLPTEAEWEYAYRGGATSKEECSYHFYFDDKLTNDLAADRANFDGNYPDGSAPKMPERYLKRTTKVGSYRPNKLGIHDMAGNVWEWCEDSYDGGPGRVLRGGGWNFGGGLCRASNRVGGALSSARDDFLGFRLARSSVR